MRHDFALGDSIFFLIPNCLRKHNFRGFGIWMITPHRANYIVDIKQVCTIGKEEIKIWLDNGHTNLALFFMLFKRSNYKTV